VSVENKSAALDLPDVKDFLYGVVIAHPTIDTSHGITT
jgi:hypothetical protein